MNVMGITSSLIDVLAFLGFWFLFGYNASKETFFQTAWFVECLISETMIIHYVRTAKRPFIESRANKWLTLGTFGTIIGTILTPILLHNIPSFHFEILPLKYYGFVILLLAIYSVLVEIIKKIYIKKNGEWL
ncbi:magnesium-translocating P-type ATPase [human gut metagenome]|uniref:Magnesium-translocating P-type ATPase n=1 Tax=human gut metagenome TaxID=408170 RepID=K1RRR4_9ZZZZ